MRLTSRFGYLTAAIDVLAVSSFLLFVSAAAWEHSTRTYLRGFSDAIVPASGRPIEKVETILQWMKTGPQRQLSVAPPQVSLRDPENTLNYQALLQVCGTATNAFVNLANSAGVPARRLLLLDQNRGTSHVTAEVYIDGRWILVDPAFRTILHDDSGRTVTREQMKDPVLFTQVTAPIPNYDPSYSYQRTVHVRLSRIPVIGLPLRKLLNHIWSRWSDSVFWTLLLERDSFAALFVTALFFAFMLFSRGMVRWYGARRLGIEPYRIRDTLFRPRLPGQREQPEDHVLAQTAGEIQ